MKSFMVNTTIGRLVGLRQNCPVSTDIRPRSPNPGIEREGLDDASNRRRYSCEPNRFEALGVRMGPARSSVCALSSPPRVPLASVIVSARHHVRSLCVEIVPKGLRPGRVPVRCPRGKERVVPDGEGTGRRVCREVGAKPLFLRRAVITRDLLAVVVGIKNDDMPGAQIVAVIALSWIAGSRAKVIEIPIGVPGLVFVVTRSGSRPVLEPTPGRVVAVL